VSPLVDLLQDSVAKVRVVALATLCNLALDFSLLRQTLIERSIVPVVVGLVDVTQEIDVRTQSLWMLKNLVYKASLDVKQVLLEHLSPQALMSLMIDANNPGLMEQALILMRNLVSGHETHVQLILDWCGQDLCIFEAMAVHLNSSDLACIKQVLYIVCNIASGGRLHKMMLMAQQDLISRVVELMSADCPEARLAAVWCIINLTWPHDPGASQRVSQLVALGCDDTLQQLVNDSDANMKDRVQLALTQFNVRDSTSSNASTVQL